MPSRRKDGRFLKNRQAETYKNRLNNISKPFISTPVSTTDFDTFSTPIFDAFSTPDFDTSFSHDFDTSFATATCYTSTATDSLHHDHSYQSSTSFDEVNDLFFSGKLRPVGNTRFVIDLETLFENMKCKKCNSCLNFKDRIGILPAGLCGHLIIKCSSCNDFARVAMGKTHNAVHGPRIFDVNTKLATGMYHSGIGPIQLNNLLTSLNLPNVSESLIRRRCEEVGSVIERLAKMSVDKALCEEGMLSKTCNVQTDSIMPNVETALCEPIASEDEPVQRMNLDGPIQTETPSSSVISNTFSSCETGTGTLTSVDKTFQERESDGILQTETHVDVDSSAPGITASADGAFQRRGSGRCFNSLSGTASLIGKKTGKIIGYSARFKKCRTCDIAKVKKKLPGKHICRKNWSGSAKSMEPDMIVEILKDAKNKENPIVTLIGDDDCTGFNRARCEVSSSLEKVSDTNHVKKNVSNKLYKLKGQYKELSVKTINALIKSFSFMLAQNKGNEENIKKSLKSVVLHQFGNHMDCGDWCHLKANPKAKHKNLPWGSDLKNENLKKELLKVFTNLDAHKLSKLDSSNVNESFNNTLRSKAPKDKHYSESSSLAHRLSAAVCQKNEGYQYVAEVHKELGLSPGNATTAAALIRDKDVKRKRIVSKTKEFKLQRQKLKSQRSSETRSAEIREGDTYCSNVIAEAQEPDLTEIPGPSADNCTENVLVYYDLETTGLGRHSSITQIAAIHEEDVFNNYATPSQIISEDASRVTGIRFNELTNELFHHNKPVTHKHPQQVLLDFLQFLIALSVNGKLIVLAAHNNKLFDSIILFNQLKSYNLWNHFCRYVIGFCDTLPFFRKLHPTFENHKQEYLAHKLLEESYSAHDALEDCRVLQSLVKNSGKVDDLKSVHFFSTQQVTSHGVVPNEDSLEHLFRAKVISRQIFKKLECSSLSFTHLKTAYQRDGFDGVYYLFSERTENGKPRISNNRKVVQKVVNFLGNEE